MIVSDQLVTALATSAVPSFAVLIGILINNQRLNDFSRNMDVRFNDLSRSVDLRFNEVNRRIEDSKDVLRSEMFRVEQVLDARLKHLEEHLR
jgi:hypothetical protein